MLRYLIAFAASLFAGGVICSAVHHSHLAGILCLVGGAVALLLFNACLMLSDEG